MILLDGKKLSQKILAEVKGEIEKIGRPLRLAVIVVGKNPVVEKFVEQKKKAAESIGIDVEMFVFNGMIAGEELLRETRKIVASKEYAGVIVQLPLPPHIERVNILNAIPPAKDIDVLSSCAIGNFIAGNHLVLPPVAGAAQAFFEEHKIPYKEKQIVIAGAGHLVGKPVALWLLSEGATFTMVTGATQNPGDILRQADIIISGTGTPCWITGDMVKEGVVVIDAGTSESEGEIAGDVDFESVAKKALFITPVPGGVGPVTIAILLSNLVVLAGSKDYSPRIRSQ